MAPRFFDLTKTEQRAPKRMNGHAHKGNMAHGNLNPMPPQSPEEHARQALARPLDLSKIVQDQMWNGKPPQPMAEQAKPIATERALLLARLLMDPRYGRRR